jgi:hypothetical protein
MPEPFQFKAEAKQREQRCTEQQATSYHHQNIDALIKLWKVPEESVI